MYNIKEDAKDKVAKESIGSAVAKGLTKGAIATGVITGSVYASDRNMKKKLKKNAKNSAIGAATVGVGALLIKKLYDKFKKEKDPQKKAEIKAKIMKAKKAKK